MSHRSIWIVAIAGLSAFIVVACASNAPEATVSSNATALTDVSARPPAQAMREASGLRKVVAVARFENRTNIAGQIAVNDAMADQLVDALIKSNQFTVLERQTVGDILGEQDFANSGRVNKRELARTGKIVAAQIMIKGTITEYEGQASKGMKGVNLGILKFGKSSTHAHVGLMIRLIDTTTGQVIDSQRAEGSSSGGGMGLTVGIFNQSESNKAPLAKATQKAIENAVEVIAARLALLPFEARVIKNLGNELVVSVGATVGAEVGDEFTVYALGEELVDPYTGELLGREEEEVGVVRITEVKEKYSKALAVGSLGPTKSGDIVRSVARY